MYDLINLGLWMEEMLPVIPKAAKTCQDDARMFSAPPIPPSVSVELVRGGPFHAEDMLPVNIDRRGMGACAQN